MAPRRGLLAFVLLSTCLIACTTSTPGSRGPGVQGTVKPLPSLTQVSVPGLHFSPSACVSFEPTHGSARGVVFLDAGHGGIDTGALGRTARGAPVVEKKITLQVVKIITAQLRDAGYRVVVSRWTDTEVRVPGAGDTNGKLFTPLGVRRDVLARISCANAARAHVLLSVHMNSFSDPREGGAMTVYDPDRTFSSTSRRLATIVHGKIMAAYRTAGISIEDRFVLRDTATGGSALTAEGARYGHLILIGPKYKTFVPTPSAMPGVIVEPLFLTHPTEASIAASSRGQMLLANAITAALLQYLR